jgi:hypothetical protein
MALDVAKFQSQVKHMAPVAEPSVARQSAENSKIWNLKVKKSTFKKKF